MSVTSASEPRAATRTSPIVAEADAAEVSHGPVPSDHSLITQFEVEGGIIEFDAGRSANFKPVGADPAPILTCRETTGRRTVERKGARLLRGGDDAVLRRKLVSPGGTELGGDVPSFGVVVEIRDGAETSHSRFEVVIRNDEVGCATSGFGIAIDRAGGVVEARGRTEAEALGAVEQGSAVQREVVAVTFGIAPGEAAEEGVAGDFVFKVAVAVEKIDEGVTAEGGEVGAEDLAFEIAGTETARNVGIAGLVSEGDPGMEIIRDAILGAEGAAEGVRVEAAGDGGKVILIVEAEIELGEDFEAGGGFIVDDNLAIERSFRRAADGHGDGGTSPLCAGNFCIGGNLDFVSKAKGDARVDALIGGEVEMAGVVTVESGDGAWTRAVHPGAGAEKAAVEIAGRGLGDVLQIRQARADRGESGGLTGSDRTEVYCPGFLRGETGNKNETNQIYLAGAGGPFEGPKPEQLLKRRYARDSEITDCETADGSRERGDRSVRGENPLGY